MSALSTAVRFKRPKKQSFSSRALSLILVLIILGLTFPDEKFPVKALFPPPALRLLVSYVYYETSLQAPCEILNKRVNLAFFLRQAVARSEGNVKFLFSHPDNFPDAKDLLDLLVDVTRKEEEFITNALQGKFRHIRFRRAQELAPDICHHQHAIRNELKRHKKLTYDFYMILNDGVRGPFMNPASTAQASDTKLPYSKVPLWLRTYISMFVYDNNIALAGSMMSCEINPHLQSWTLLFNGLIKDLAFRHMQAACAPDMNWVEMITIGEVGLSTDVLDSGYSIASILPKFPRFTVDHRIAIKHELDEVVRKLFYCKNPWIAGNLGTTELDINEMVFVKHGGEVWRKHLLPKSFTTAVMEQSADVVKKKHLQACGRLQR